MNELKPGDVIGNCRIEEKIAQGGMGAVYRGRQLSLDRVVAIKVLKPDLTQSEDVLQRFTREGKLLAQLDHRSIIKIYDVGNQDQKYFLVMEFIDGEDLHQIIKKSGPLSSKEVLKIAEDVADGLHYAHSLGIIHRDIKPSNIIRAADGSVRITDFGIARLSSEDSLLTQEGTLVGTPVYMSPEQCRGTNLDSRSDLYNLGATLYALVSGKQPFAGRNPTTLVQQILHENARPLDIIAPGVDPALLALIKRLMARHPGARFQTGQELVTGIRQINDKKSSRSSTTPRATASSLIQNGALLTVAFTCITILAIVLSVAWPYLKPEDSGGGDAYASSSTETSESVQSSSKKPRPNKLRPESPDDNLTAQLERRAQSFSEAVLSGDEDAAILFVEPKSRDNAGLQMSLGYLVDKVSALGDRAKVQQRVRIRDRGAKVIFSFNRDSRSEPIMLALEWVVLDGGWYIRPDSREAGGEGGF